jgi:hypothetical protein
MQELKNIFWEDVLDTLQEEKCVLFLGQGAYKGITKGGIQEELMDWLDIQNPDHPHIRLYNPDGFYLFKKRRFKRKVIGKMKDFYNQSFPKTEEEFKKLAQIPFSMIFSITPDNLLARTFDELGFEYSSDFYFRHRKATEHFNKPTNDKPLIYNLLGNIEEPESLVLTHNDFFDYLDSIFKGNSMNDELKYELESAERYIFLGLPYEKWYFPLLLRVLSMHSDKLKEVERLALQEFENPHLHELYTQEFKIEFIPSEITLFIETLYQKCDEEGILKKIPEKQVLSNAGDFNPQQIKSLIGEAKTKDAMEQLSSHFERYKVNNNKYANDLLVLRNRYNLLRQRELRGTIYPQDFAVENNQIVEQLLDLINIAETL